MGKAMTEFVDKLAMTGCLSDVELTDLLKFRNAETTEYLFEAARTAKRQAGSDGIQIWGRILLSNYCKNDCKMCGLQRENQFLHRYRLSMDQILLYCKRLADQKIYTVVLESGDDAFYTEHTMSLLLVEIKKNFPMFKIILSVGDKNEFSFRQWKQCGASGYILSHGSANEMHFKKIFPSNMSPLLKRQKLWQLKELGYQTGTGFLVGMPYQNLSHVLEDIKFIKSFGPSIINMGAFVPALRTAFENQRSGNGEMTIYIMAILRLLLPSTNIIAEPSLDCVMKEGRVRAFDGGANVLLVDVSEFERLAQYGAYERKNGRLMLGADDIREFRERLGVNGFEETV